MRRPLTPEEREQRHQEKLEKQRERYHNDPEYRKRLLALCREYRKTHSRTDLEHRLRKNEYCRKKYRAMKLGIPTTTRKYERVQDTESATTGDCQDSLLAIHKREGDRGKQDQEP